MGLPYPAAFGEEVGPRHPTARVSCTHPSAKTIRCRIIYVDSTQGQRPATHSRRTAPHQPSDITFMPLSHRAKLGCAPSSGTGMCCSLRAGPEQDEYQTIRWWQRCIYRASDTGHARWAAGSLYSGERD
jgi:hypothetical protein